MPLNKPYIKEIRIDRYRSFNKVDIDTDWLNIYSGANNAGKSNVLKALDLFFNFKDKPFIYERDYNKAYTEAAGGKRLVRIEIIFNGRGDGALRDDFSIIREFSYNNDMPVTIFKSTNEKIQAELDDAKGNTQRQFNTFLNRIKYYYIPAVRSKEFVTDFLNNFNEIIEADAISGPKFKNTKEEMAKILKNKSKDLSVAFKAFIGLPATATISSNKINIGIDVDSGIRVRAKGKEKKVVSKPIDLFSSGDGILMSYVAYFLNYLCQMQSYKYFIWGFEEPENSLEYSKVQTLANEFYTKFTKVAQVFLTTHSPAFIKLKEKTNTSFYRVYKDPENPDKQITLVETIDDIKSRQMTLLKNDNLDHADLLEKEIGMVELAHDIENTITEYTERRKKLYIINKKNEEKLRMQLNQIKNGVCIITEGKTDVVHLRHALTKLGLDTENIHFLDIPEGGFGDRQLENFLCLNARKPNTGKIIGIFDRDNPEIIQSVEAGNTPFKTYGNNVFAFCIPPLAGQERLSIEHYYGAHAKTPDKEGRRLFFGSDFAGGKDFLKSNLKDKTGKYVITKSGKWREKIAANAILDEVLDIERNVNVALSKDAFAKNVVPLLKDFDWEAFRPIIARIQQIRDL